jgi:hypothetical protein
MRVRAGVHDGAAEQGEQIPAVRLAADRPVRIDVEVVAGPEAGAVGVRSNRDDR